MHTALWESLFKLKLLVTCDEIPLDIFFKFSSGAQWTWWADPLSETWTAVCAAQTPHQSSKTVLQIYRGMLRT